MRSLTHASVNVRPQPSSQRRKPPGHTQDVPFHQRVSTLAPDSYGISTLFNSGIVRYGDINPAAVLAMASEKPRMIIPNRGRAKRRNRQSDAAGGGPMTGVQAAHSELSRNHRAATGQIVSVALSNRATSWQPCSTSPARRIKRPIAAERSVEYHQYPSLLLAESSSSVPKPA